METKSLARIWMRLHSYLSVFFLPVALLYAVTGGLYIMGVQGSADRTSFEVSTDQPLPNDLDTLRAFVAAELQAHNQPVPQGDTRSVHGRFAWGSPTGYSVTLEPPGESGKARIQCSTPSLYNRLVMLHKAKCGGPFKALGIAFAIAMALIYLSGIVIGWRAVSLRKPFLAALAGGLALTIISVLTSI